VAHGHNTECLFFVFDISVIVSLLVLEEWGSQQPGLPSGSHFETLSLDCFDRLSQTSRFLNEGLLFSRFSYTCSNTWYSYDCPL
jgi:hypothetical protein